MNNRTTNDKDYEQHNHTRHTPATPPWTIREAPITRTGWECCLRRDQPNPWKGAYVLNIGSASLGEYDYEGKVEADTDIPAAYEAVVKVFSTTELLERVLLLTDERSLLLSCQRVNKRFAEVIHQSASLQQKLWFRPVATESLKAGTTLDQEWQINPFLEGPLDPDAADHALLTQHLSKEMNQVFGAKSVNTPPPARPPKVSRLPLLEQLQDGSVAHVVRVKIHRADGTALENPAASWRRMIVTQPMLLGEYWRVGERNEGTGYSWWKGGARYSSEAVSTFGDLVAKIEAIDLASGEESLWQNRGGSQAIVCSVYRALDFTKSDAKAHMTKPLRIKSSDA